MHEPDWIEHCRRKAWPADMLANFCDALRWLVRPGPIEVPPLADRKSELPRIVDEYVFDAVVDLAPPPRSLALAERDRQWLIEHTAAMSLSELEKAALRLVALRSSVNMSNAAFDACEK